VKTPERSWIAVALVIALAAWLSIDARMDAMAGDRWIGSLDAASYASQGRALAEGDGLYIRYISSFYRPYDPAIWRPDDHWPPAMGIALAPLFWLLGASVETARLGSLLVATAALPMAAAALAGVVGRSATAALVAGLLVMHTPIYVKQSVEPMSDLLLATLTVAMLACVVQGGRWLLLGGFLAAATWYAKGSHLVMAVAFPAMVVAVHGLPALRSRSLMGAQAVLFATLLPLLALNTSHYGTPVLSTQSQAGTYVGYGGWYSEHTRIYWGLDEPQFEDRWSQGLGPYAERAWLNARTYGGMLLAGSPLPQHRIGVGARASRPRMVDPHREVGEPRERRGREYFLTPEVALVNAPGALALVVLLLRSLRRGLGALRRRGTEALATPWSRETGLAWMLAVYFGVFAAGIIALWVVVWRYAYPGMVVLTAVSVGLAVPRLRSTADDRGFWFLAGLSTLLVLAGWAGNTVDRADLDPPRTTMSAAEEVARWAAEAHPDGTVIMMHHALQMTFYGPSEVRGVVLPYSEDPAHTLGVAWYYGVSYILDRTGPTVEGVRQAWPDALRPVAGGPAGLLAIDWSAVPEGGVQLPGGDADIR
jgi:hypothetical protein